MKDKAPSANSEDHSSTPEQKLSSPARRPTLWSAAEAARVTGGTLSGDGDWQAGGVSIDTRTLVPGDLFIATKGRNGDGHDFVQDALAAGAAAAVVDYHPDGVARDAPLLIVEDTLEALQDLGRGARARCGATVVAVTGSVGKTGTKEMLARAFGALGQTHASEKSYNNLWGVPLSLARMNPGSDYAAFEVGMNHPGEITPLTGQVRPNIAIITKVAAVHIENFPESGIDGIADAKAEIFDGLEPGGVAIINRDDKTFPRVKASAMTKGVRHIATFGEHEEADARLIGSIDAANGTRVSCNIAGQEISFTLRSRGRHIAMNTLPVLLAVHLSGGDIFRAAEALSAIEPLPGRGRTEKLDIGDVNNPLTLIDESYNASPTSMKAAFKVLAMIDPGRGGRRIAVLGEMKELGADAPRLHAELALPLKAANVDLVYTCGAMMKHLHDNLAEEQKGAHGKDAAELAEIVPEVLSPGDVVMVKGSRGTPPPGLSSQMEIVVEALRALPGSVAGHDQARARD